MDKFTAEFVFKSLLNRDTLQKFMLTFKNPGFNNNNNNRYCYYYYKSVINFCISLSEILFNSIQTLDTIKEEKIKAIRTQKLKDIFGVLNDYSFLKATTSILSLSTARDECISVGGKWLILYFEFINKINDNKDNYNYFCSVLSEENINEVLLSLSQSFKQSKSFQAILKFLSFV